MSAVGATEETPIYSEALAEHIRLAGVNRGTVRALVVPRKDHSVEKLRAALSEFQMLTGREKAPGMYEIEVLSSDLDRLSLKDDVFEWFDLSERLYGESITDPEATAVVKLYTSDPGAARKAVTSAGGRVAGLSADGTMLGSLPAGSLRDLLMADGIDAIEITGSTTD